MSKVTQLPTEINFNGLNPWSVGGGNLPVSPADGWVTQITSAEFKENSNKNGGFIEFTHQIVEGEHSGKTGTHRINVYHSTSPQAEEIGRRQLLSYKLICGLNSVQNLNAFVGKPMRTLVRLQSGDEAQEKGWTEITGIKDVNGGNPSYTAGAAGVTPSPVNPAPAVNTEFPVNPAPVAQPTPTPEPTQEQFQQASVPTKPAWAQ